VLVDGAHLEIPSARIPDGASISSSPIRPTHRRGSVTGVALLSLGPVNLVRARHDLRTLAGLLSDDVDEPLEQLRTLGDHIAASFTTPAADEAADPAHLDVGRVLLALPPRARPPDRRPHRLKVASASSPAARARPA